MVGAEAPGPHTNLNFLRFPWQGLECPVVPVEANRSFHKLKSHQINDDSIRTSVLPSGWISNPTKHSCCGQYQIWYLPEQYITDSSFWGVLNKCKNKGTWNCKPTIYVINTSDTINWAVELSHDFVPDTAITILIWSWETSTTKSHCTPFKSAAYIAVGTCQYYGNYVFQLWLKL